MTDRMPPDDPGPHDSATPGQRPEPVAAHTPHAPGWERDTLERLAFASLTEQRQARRAKRLAHGASASKSVPSRPARSGLRRTTPAISSSARRRVAPPH